MKPSAVTTAEFDLDPIFDPPEAMIDRILHDIAGPEGSLRNLALAFSTTAPALAAWLARPDIAARLEALHTAAAMRVRLVAATALPRVVSVALAIINQFHSDESHVITRTSSIREAEYRRRGAETARRAASLIARLANYAARRTPNSPSQREGAGGWASPRSNSPSLREGAGGRANGLIPSPEQQHTTVAPAVVQPFRLYAPEPVPPNSPTPSEKGQGTHAHSSVPHTNAPLPSAAPGVPTVPVESPSVLASMPRCLTPRCLPQPSPRPATPVELTATDTS